MGGAGRFSRFLRTTLIGLCLAMAASWAGYHGMLYYLSRDTAPVGPPPPRVRDDATRIQYLTNETVRLMNDYLHYFPLAEGFGAKGAAQWAQQVFLPRLEALRDQLPRGGTGRAAPYPELRGLFNRMFTMASHPSDQRLRRATVEELQALHATVRHYMLGLNLVPDLNKPPPSS